MTKMVKAKKGKWLKAAAAAAAAYAGSKYLGAKGMKGNVSKTAAGEDANIKAGLIDAISGGTKFKKNIGKVPYKKFTGIAKTGAMVTAKVGTMIKAKKGWGKKLAGAAVAAGTAYAASKYLKGKGGPKLKGTNVLDYEGEAAGLHGKGKSSLVDAADAGTKFAKKKIKAPVSDLFSGTMGISKEGGSVKAKHGKMVKARGGVIVNTKLNGPLFTETF